MKLTPRIEKLMLERAELLTRYQELREQFDDPDCAHEHKEHIDTTMDNIRHSQSQIERQVCALLENHLLVKA